MEQTKSNKDTMKLCSSETSALLLLDMLQTMNIQLYAFDAIFQWAHKCATEVHHDFKEKPPRRENIISDISEKLGLLHLTPVTSAITLENTNVETDLTTVSVRECIFSLLSDNNLMKEENLLFSGTSPLDPPDETVMNDPDHIFDDINSGTSFYAAWKKHCPTGSGKVLLPLILFIDKSFLDKKGKLNSEPITFTLGIFKRDVRNNNPNAWRSIGHIADAFMSGYHEPIEKAKDYHQMMSFILSELKTMQSSGGVAWDLHYNGKNRVTFVPVVHMIITDTKAADDMVGKIQFRGTTADQMPARLCRFCDTPSSEIDQPQHQYILTQATDIQCLYVQRHYDALDSISYRPLRNAFWDLEFADPAGINGSIPPDTLHVIQKGIHMYLRECFFDMLRLDTDYRKVQKAVQRKKEQEQQSRARKRQNRSKDDQSNVPSVVVKKLTEEQMGKYRIFTKKSRPWFEAISRSISKQLKRQSDRDLPRTHFAQGVTQHFAKLSGTEETGVLLIILLTLCSTAGSDMFCSPRHDTTNMGTERYSNWIGTIERFLQLEQWAKDVEHNRGHSRREVGLVQDYIGALIDRLKSTLQRRSGLGTKLIKVHLLRHLVESHIKFGRLENCNTASGETRHKHFVKNAGKQTQKRKETFDREVSRRNVESVIIHSGVSNMSCENHIRVHTRRVGLEGCLYHIKQSKILKHYRSRNHIPPDDNSLPAGVHAALVAVRQFITGSSYATVYHTYSDGASIFRAAPAYDGEAWYDWAHIRKNPEGCVDDQATLTARLLLFFKVSRSTKVIPICGMNVNEDKGYVLYEYLNGTESWEPTHPESVMLFSSRLAPGIHCAEVTDIVSPAIVYQDIEFVDNKDFDLGVKTGPHFGIIKPRRHWSPLFMHRVENDERL